MVGTGSAAEVLRQLGFEEDAAVVFSTLAAIGPSPAGAVAKAAGISRPQAYRALDELSARGIVHNAPTRPRVYAAVGADELLDLLRRDLEAQTNQLSLLSGILRARLGNRPAKPPTFHTDIVRGRAALTVHVEQMVDRAQSTINILATHPVATIPAFRRSGVWKQLAGRVKNGVDVRLVLRKTSDNAAALATLGPRDPAVRLMTTALAMSSQSVDGLRGFLLLVSDPSRSMRAENTVALVSDTPAFVGFLETGFEAIWRQCGENG